MQKTTKSADVDIDLAKKYIPEFEDDQYSFKKKADDNIGFSISND
jgi:hypothetical protein